MFGLAFTSIESNFVPFMGMMVPFLFPYVGIMRCISGEQNTYVHFCMCVYIYISWKHDTLKNAG